MKDFLKAVVYGAIFAIPFITLIVADELFFPFITGKNYTFRVLVEIMFFGWILLALLDPKYRPRWSWVLGGFGLLVGVMFLANLTGAHPATSIWSNFERMDGYVTLVHMFLYMLVAGTMLQTKNQWTWFWYTSLTVATAVAIHGLGQSLGWFEGGGSRVDSRLGNAAYMAIYMLFHIFLAIYLFVREQRVAARVIFALVAVLCAYVLLETGTRGTAIGLVVGVGVMTAYIALFAGRFPQFRIYAISACAVFALIVGGFLAARDTSFVQESSTLSRIANIDLQEDLEVRMTIWNIAWQGAQDRPILGWGQENFNFVFNQYYDPFLYDQEQWFDRVHNIFLDWLIAGGVLGLLAYLLLFGSAIYYVVRHTAQSDEERGFTVLEQGVLLGLLVGYLTHNMVVFDNIVSYLFFASVLAMIHSRVSHEIPAVVEWRIHKDMVRYTIAPAVLVVAFATIYYVNFPSLYAAGHILDALRSQDIDERREWFTKAFDRSGSVGQQEVAEQMVQATARIARAESLPESTRQAFVNQTEIHLEQVATDKPDDARVHVFRGSFYRSIGALAEARDAFARASELSPRKQSIIMQQGVTALQMDNLDDAAAFFAEALELDERNQQARQFYVATLFRQNDIETARELWQSGSEAFQQAFAGDQYAFQSVAIAEDYETLVELYELRVALDGSDPQTWTSWAVAHLEAGDPEEAIAVLELAGETLPDFASVAGCYAANIAQGEDPEDDCE